MAAKSGVLGAVYAPSSLISVTFTNEATTGNAERTEYTINDTTKRYWDPAATFLVEQSTDGGTTWTAVSASDYTLIHAGGTVKFATARPAGALIRVSGKYYTMEQKAGFFTWSIEPGIDLVDATTFQSGGWKEFVAVNKGWTASAERFWLDNTFFSWLDQLVVAVFYIDTSAGQKQRYEGFCRLSGVTRNAPVNELIRETVNFQGVGALYYREG